MKQDTLQAQGDDGKTYTVLRTTPLILGSGLEGIPSFRPDTGETLVPTAEPHTFKLARSGIVLTLSAAKRFRVLDVRLGSMSGDHSSR